MKITAMMPMKTWASQPSALLDAAELEMSPRISRLELDHIFKLCRNPFPEGQARHEATVMDTWKAAARRLIWC